MPYSTTRDVMKIALPKPSNNYTFDFTTDGREKRITFSAESDGAALRYLKDLATEITSFLSKPLTLEIDDGDGGKNGEVDGNKQ